MKYKGLLILLYGIIILGLFAVFYVEILLNGSGFFGPNSQISEQLIAPITFQLGVLTAWMFGNNNKPKK